MTVRSVRCPYHVWVVLALGTNLATAPGACSGAHLLFTVLCYRRTTTERVALGGRRGTLGARPPLMTGKSLGGPKHKRCEIWRPCREGLAHRLIRVDKCVPRVLRTRTGWAREDFLWSYLSFAHESRAETWQADAVFGGLGFCGGTLLDLRCTYAGRLLPGVSAVVLLGAVMSGTILLRCGALSRAPSTPPSQCPALAFSTRVAWPRQSGRLAPRASLRSQEDQLQSS